MWIGCVGFFVLGNMKEMKMVSINYNAEQASYEELEGVPVTTARLQLRAVHGIPGHARCRVNGISVSGDYRLCQGDALEFVVLWGFKGGADSIWMVDDSNRLVSVPASQVEKYGTMGFRPVPSGNGVGLEFLPFIAGYLGQIEHSLRRIADHFDPPPPNVVTTRYVADKLNCTLVHAARQAADGDIPRSCVVPGTGGGKPWKFYRSRIDQWIEQR